LTETIINLTRGIPPSEAFPVQDLIDCAATALQQDPNVLLQYGRSPGYAPLREWLAEQYNVGADQILTGNSSLELFSFITESMLAPGQRAFVESPSYDRSITLLRRAGAELVGIPLQTDGIDLDVMEAELAKGAPVLMYLITDFQNPMGVTTSLEKRQRLVEWAEAYDFWLIEDAPYRKLRYWGEEVPSLRALAPERVLQMSSFSKILSPGLRLGYLVGPTEAIAALSAWAVDSYIGPVLPTQGLVYEYCRRGLLASNIERLKAMYRPRLTTVLAALEQHVPEATWTRPEGGFFVSVELPGEVHIADLLARAGEAGLKLSDGRGFFPNAHDGDRFLRIPFCSLTPEQIDSGVARLAQLL